MPILLPNLDDRRWADLVSEGRSLIPLYAPEWTDQNAHDPGITLIELLAWFAEMDIFSLNRITDRARLKFLSLVGIQPEPPRPARTVLSFSLMNGGPLLLPAGVEFSGLDPFSQPVVFQTLRDLRVQPANLAAVQVRDASGFHDLTDRWMRAVPFGAFGDVPQVGAELYLGFDAVLSAGEPLSLFFTFANARASRQERSRIVKEAAEQRSDCSHPSPRCGKSDPVDVDRCTGAVPPFKGARVVWELATASGAQITWVTLLRAAVADDTRTFTLTGGVTVTPPVSGSMQKLGQVPASLCYLRIRLAAGNYDSPPMIGNVAANAVAVEQQSAAGAVTWTIAPGVSTPAAPADPVGLQLAFNSAGQISALSFVSDDSPRFRVLGLTPPTATTAGWLTIEAVLVGNGDGTPYQQMTLPDVPVKQQSVHIVTYEDGGWRAWRSRPSLDASGRSDADFLIDATTGVISFGDGENGRVVPERAMVLAKYVGTRAEAGNLLAKKINKLSDSLHNRALLGSGFADASGRLLSTNPLPAICGEAAEPLDAAIARATQMLAKPQRAITAGDCEALALETPGTDIARVKAWADHHPDFACFEAPGIVTVVILPNMPVPAPVPSPALLRSVSAYLSRRRIIGSRIFVTGPAYRTVTVRARIQPASGTDKSAVATRVFDALNAFFHPLTGGPAGKGWPFGRDVFRTEVLQLIDQAPGVDYVAGLELFSGDCLCNPQCGNICLAPTELVAAGSHEIEVL